MDWVPYNTGNESKEEEDNRTDPLLYKFSAMPDDRTVILQLSFKSLPSSQTVVETRQSNALLEIEGTEVKGVIGRKYDVVRVTVPQWVQSIGANAFSNCSRLTSVTLPKGLKRIGINAFASCTALTSIVLPNSLDQIGYQAFHNCTNLTSIRYQPLASYAFIVWAVSRSRKRSNWQLTTLSRLPNVLKLVAQFGFSSRDVTTLDPYGSKLAFPLIVFLTKVWEARTRHKKPTK